MMGPVAVIGAGSWGTALAWLLGNKGQAVRLWGRDAELIRTLRKARRNKKYLPETPLPATIEAVEALPEALNGAETVVLAVPSRGMRATVGQLKEWLPPEALVVSAAKGLESDTGLRMSQVITETLGWDEPTAARRLGVLSGPNLAKEVVAGLPASSVVACRSEETCRRLQELFRTSRFRVYTNPDVTGVEMGGALKNVIAIGAGMSDGAGFGDNAKAALVTRALHEIASLGVAEGARAETFAGLAGLGDLVVTCISKQSRNYTLGFRLAQGEALEKILSSTPQIAEGYPTARAVYELARRHGLDMPISTLIYEILYLQRPLAAGVEALMTRASKSELEGPSPKA